MRRILLASVVWALCSGSLLANGDITAITVNPLPIPVGTTVTHGATVVGNPPMFGYDWYWRCTASPGASGWTFFGDTAGVFVLENRVGTQDKWVDGTFFSATGFGNQHVSSFSRSIDVLHPTHDTILIENPSTVGSLSTPMKIRIKYPVWCGSLPIGFDGVAGFAQRRIRRPQLGQDTDWETPNSTEFIFVPGDQHIREYKSHMQNLDWAAWPQGYIFDDFYQQHRMIIMDCHGVWQTFEFPVDRHFLSIKVNDDQWSLNEAP